MKKLIVLVFTLFASILLEAQEEEYIKEMDILFNHDQIRLRVDKRTVENFSLRTIIKLKEEKFEVSEGLIFYLDKKMYVLVGIGFEQFYGKEGISCIVHGSFKGNFDWGKVMINYGPNWTSYKVSSSVIRYFGSSFGVGISSGDRYIGPRIECRIKVKSTKVRLHVSYLNGIDYGLKLSF